MLAQNIALGLQRSRIRAHSAKVGKARQGNCPDVHGVNYVATVKLGEELASDTWVSGDRIKHTTNQNAIG